MQLHHKYLPNRPSVKINESLPSYIIRLTQANGLLSINDLLSLLFKNFHNPKFAMDVRGPWTNGELFDSPKKDFGYGIEYNEIFKCTFYNLYNNIDKSYRYFDNLSNLEKNNYLINENKISESLYICPYCVNDYGYINKYWSFQNFLTSKVKNKNLNCLIHKTKLLNSCPRCNNKFSYDQIFISMEYCLSCGSKFKNYNLPINSKSMWIEKGNYLFLEIINSKGVNLPYLPRDKIRYYNFKKPLRSLNPYNISFWNYYFKLLGTKPEFLKEFEFLLRTKNEFKIMLHFYGKFLDERKELDLDFEFGYKAFNNKLENINYFPSLLWNR